MDEKHWVNELNERLERQAISLPPMMHKVRGVIRRNDSTLNWVEREYPQLRMWRPLAVEWLKGEISGVGAKLGALGIFLERYIVQKGLPLEPAVFLSRETILPDFRQSVCPPSKQGVRYANSIHAFLNFVLLRELSTRDDDGKPVISPAHHNPVARCTMAGLPRLDESVHSPLPYGYIDELRQMLAAGPSFRDWQFAQNALGAELGKRGRSGPDWFPVQPSQIDRDDPDCVWRERTRSKAAGGATLEMWSPARWVALLIKLIIPLRTFQVRMLDSGEADTWRYSDGRWTLNDHPLAGGTGQQPIQQGVFRRTSSLPGESVQTVLYVNTNKTQDIAKFGPDKGYVLPWAASGRIHESAFYWLEKLRNWQEKYNPIDFRTPWPELDGRHIKAKSGVQLASYPNACFLFRLAEIDIGEEHLPIGESTLLVPWFKLLQAMEARLAARGETHRNGAPIRLLPPPENQNSGLTTLFPLHSLRVSLVTALALEGQVPFPVLQKLVGHSRLLMTLYYTKPGATRISDVLTDAAGRLATDREASIERFLLDTEHDALLQLAICNSAPSLGAAIPQHPAARNPVGWMPLHHGLCLVGGNTSEVEESSSIGGCHNGGPNVGSASVPKHTAVPGGSRNCVRCRWFVTQPPYLAALVAHFNNISYHLDEARNACLGHEATLHELKKQKADSEYAGQPFSKLDSYRQAERVVETALKKFSDLAEDLVACYRLIARCKAALECPEGDGTQLVAAGTATDVHLVFEEVESELLQLAGVCQNAEIYPDLEPGKAVFRRSQLLDSVLYQEGLLPAFMLLSEGDQLRLGNAFMNKLSQQMNPTNPALGQREVIQLMDAGSDLSERLGIDLAALVPLAMAAKPMHTLRGAP